MEGAPLDLVEGHIHQAWDKRLHEPARGLANAASGLLARLDERAPERCDEEPLSGDLVPELLVEQGFAAEKWRHWKVDPQPTNPGLRQQPPIPPPSGPKPKQSYVR